MRPLCCHESDGSFHKFNVVLPVRRVLRSRAATIRTLPARLPAGSTDCLTGWVGTACPLMEQSVARMVIRLASG